MPQYRMTASLVDPRGAHAPRERAATDAAPALSRLL